MRVKPSHIVLLVVALAFGMAGWLLTHLYPPGGSPLSGQADVVNSAAFWQTSLTDLAGRRQSLVQWRGKVVVANFWATWCPPCRHEIPVFIRMQGRYAQSGVQFIGLAVDDQEAVASLARQAGFNYPILLASEASGTLFQATGNAMGGLPYTVVFDRQGKAVATFTGEVPEARLEQLLKPLT